MDDSGRIYKECSKCGAQVLGDRDCPECGEPSGTASALAERERCAKVVEGLFPKCEKPSCGCYYQHVPAAIRKDPTETQTDPNTCPWCGRENEGNAGDYYHEKDCHRRDVLRRMDELSQRGGTKYLMEQLERELAEAAYTGD